MIISANIIIKDDNELESLKRCVASFTDYVDEIILVANGKSVKQISEWASGQDKINCFYHKWTKNFSEQRNFAMSKIRKDTDFVIWFDADDVLVGGDRLREFAIKAKKNRLDSLFFNYWYLCDFDGEPAPENVKDVIMNQMRERLLRPGSFTWHKRVHETPIPVENMDYKYMQVKYSQEDPITWLHLGITKETSLEKQVEKMERNRELLELELADERITKEGADPRTLLYLMKIYGEISDEKLQTDLIKMGEEYLTKSGWDAERAICCTLIAKALGNLGQEKEAKDFLFNSVKEYPYDPLLYLHLSRVCYNLGQFHEMKHWLTIGLNLDNSDTTASMTNIGEMKILSSRLLMNYYFNGERNMKKAYESMRILYKEDPTPENKENLDYLKSLNDLDNASRSAHELMLYYESLNDSLGVVRVVDSMPKKMQNLPFAWHMYNKHKFPRTWKSNEICYYATFGQEHFESWNGHSIEKGIGGSETAVIKLSEEWVKSGYRVVVYCDTPKAEEINGVIYLPYYQFNPRDSFNIFLAWRSTHLIEKIKTKKFYIDLHDLIPSDYLKKYNKIDKVFFKSKYHKSLADYLPESKIVIISNGID